MNLSPMAWMIYSLAAYTSLSGLKHFITAVFSNCESSWNLRGNCSFSGWVES